MDIFGSNAYAEGGALGRGDGVYISIEAQKSAGALHAHGQFFLQCPHQHLTLEEILGKYKDKLATLAATYKRYEEHTRKEIYHNIDQWINDKPNTEKQWSEYSNSFDLISVPDYLGTGSAESPTDFVQSYLQHFQKIQGMKQNHVHKWSAKKQRFEPLDHCKRTDKPHLCKSDFPRTTWMIDKSVVLCPGLLEKLNMPARGQRHYLGAFHGPLNCPSLNGTSPAISIATCVLGGACNTDFQIPYRLPPLPEIHANDHCQEPTCTLIFDLQRHTRNMINITRRSQSMQIGYQTDSQNKRLCKSFYEIREFEKSHKMLQIQVQESSIGVANARHTQRIASQLYLSSTVRSHQEVTNLHTHRNQYDPTAAQTIRTCQSIHFPGYKFVNLIERCETINASSMSTSEAMHDEVDSEPEELRLENVNKLKNRILPTRDIAKLYAYRPKHPEVWYLPPYDFFQWWQFVPVKYAQKHSQLIYQDKNCHALMTKSGIVKLIQQECSQVGEDFILGHDYIINERGGADWIPLPNIPELHVLRHQWVIQRHRRPKDPSLVKSPIPRDSWSEKDKTSRLLMTYFHPYTLIAHYEDERVPLAYNLQAPHRSWYAAAQHWLQGNLLCVTTKNHIQNMLGIRWTPSQDAHVHSDDEKIEDNNTCDVTEETLMDLTKTFLNTRHILENDTSKDKQKMREHLDQAKHGMELIDKVWHWELFPPTSISEAQPRQQSKDEIKAIKNNAFDLDKNANIHEHPPKSSCKKTHIMSKDGINKWLQDKIQRREVNSEQQQVLEKIVHRIIAEEFDATESQITEPLRWLVHGGPGTGKTHLIKLIRELFTEELGWTSTVQYKIAAFQNSNADLIEGQTLHVACGLKSPWTQKPQKGNRDILIKTRELPQLRWLIIDEISMVSSEMLAEIHHNLSKQMSDVCKTSKYGNDKFVRMFGGVNVLLLGDFCQMGATHGHSLTSAPYHRLQASSQFVPQSLEAEGKDLLWHPQRDGIQGITDLSVCERLDRDQEWLLSVQNEFRQGALSVDSHAFLHGHPTSVPGSYLKDKCLCGSSICTNLLIQEVSAQEILEKECDICREERKWRCLVLQDADDPRCHSPTFINAPCIFPNRNMAFHANKTRGINSANLQEKCICWVHAIDKALHHAMITEPDQCMQKDRWLTYHDAATSNYYGLLPLFPGMPIQIIDHINRHPAVRIMKGRRGIVHSYVLDERDESVWKNGNRCLTRPPLCVYVLRKTSTVTKYLHRSKFLVLLMHAAKLSLEYTRSHQKTLHGF